MQTNVRHLRLLHVCLQMDYEYDCISNEIGPTHLDEIREETSYFREDVLVVR
jgi:hypothetical protein